MSGREAIMTVRGTAVVAAVLLLAGCTGGPSVAVIPVSGVAPNCAVDGGGTVCVSGQTDPAVLAQGALADASSAPTTAVTTAPNRAATPAANRAATRASTGAATRAATQAATTASGSLPGQSPPKVPTKPATTTQSPSTAKPATTKPASTQSASTTKPAAEFTTPAGWGGGHRVGTFPTSGSVHLVGRTSNVQSTVSGSCHAASDVRTVTSVISPGITLVIDVTSARLATITLDHGDSGTWQVRYIGDATRAIFVSAEGVRVSGAVLPRIKGTSSDPNGGSDTVTVDADFDC
jgi:hypothetical protein